MIRAAILRLGLAALASSAAAGFALAQQDVQITNEAIIQTCTEIHHSTNVQVDPPTIGGAQGITLNCRLIGAGGVTIAQVTPGEVCQRLTGSTEWHRGMGTQVFCRASGAEKPAPRSFTITQEDIAKACQRVHRNPRATADPTTVGRYGLELNCRLVNANGVTLARVSPEDVCETKFGTREWIGIAGSTSFLCKGTPIDIAQPQQLPNKPPPPGPAPLQGGGGAPKAFNDVPLTPEALAEGCRALHGASASAAPLTFEQYEPVIKCNAAGGLVTHTAAQFCPKLSGTPDWYMRALGTHGMVCRGPNPPQFDALGDVRRYCRDKGFVSGNNGIAARQQPVCHQGRGGGLTPITLANVCSGLYGVTAYEIRGVVHWCLATPRQVAVAPRLPPLNQNIDGTPPFQQPPPQQQERKPEPQQTDKAPMSPELKERLDSAKQEKTALEKELNDRDNEVRLGGVFVELARKSGDKEELKKATEKLDKARADRADVYWRRNRVSTWIDDAEKLGPEIADEVFRNSIEFFEALDRKVAETAKRDAMRKDGKATPAELAEQDKRVEQADRASRDVATRGVAADQRKNRLKYEAERAELDRMSRDPRASAADKAEQQKKVDQARRTVDEARGLNESKYKGEQAELERMSRDPKASAADKAEQQKRVDQARERAEDSRRYQEAIQRAQPGEKSGDSRR